MSRGRYTTRSNAAWLANHMTKRGDPLTVTQVNGGEAPPTPARLATAPGYQARRLYQAYLAAWVRTVDATLTGPQFAVLTAISANPGVDQGSVAASVALDRSTMADIVRRLEERCLIVRETAMHDGRRKLLYLSKTGAKVYEDVSRRAHELDERLLGGHSPAERKRLIGELSALAERWEQLSASS